MNKEQEDIVIAALLGIDDTLKSIAILLVDLYAQVGSISEEIDNGEG